MSNNFLLIAVCLFALTASGCQQGPQPSAQLDKPNSESVVPTTSSSPEIAIVQPDSTTQPISFSLPQKISRNEDGIPFNPIIYGQNVVWQEAPDINQAKIKLTLFDLVSENRQNITSTDKVARINIKKGAAILNDQYIVWMEAIANGATGSTSLYYSRLGGKDRNLIVKYPAYLSFNAGASATRYYLDGDKLYYLSEDTSQTGTWKIFDLSANKAAGEFSIAPLIEKYHSNLLFLGVYNGAYYYFIEGRLIAVDIPSGKQILNQILSILSPFGSYIQLSQGKLMWAQGINSTVVINSFDIITKAQAVIAELPVSMDNFMGFGISNNRLIWGALISKDSNEANLFIKNSKSDSINILEKTGIHFPASITKSFNFPKMISGDYVIFPGYEGDLKDDFSNIGLYAVRIFKN